MYWDYYFKRESNSSSESRFATLLNNGKIRTDNNILKLHLRASEWNFITLPFDVKVSDIVPDDALTQWVIRRYDGAKRAAQEFDEPAGDGQPQSRALHIFVPFRVHAGVDRAVPASDEIQMEWFRDYLTDNGITTTIRKSRGEDILAACGMLVNALNA